MSTHKPTQITRYRVCYWEAPDVSYSTGLGSANARRWAMDNAARFGGRVLAEHANGTEQEVKPYGNCFGTPVLGSL